MTHPIKTTSWLHVLIAFFAGCTIAIHIGKLPAAIPLLIDQLQTSLPGAGMVVAAFSVITGLTGLVMGGHADRIGHRQAALAGLIICASGSLLGAMVTSLPWLLATRVLEGLGFIFAVVALPALIASSSTPHDRPLALGLWGAFVPAGMGFMLLLSPWLITTIGWRGVWVVAGSVTLALGLWVAVSFRQQPSPARERIALADSLRLVGHKDPLCLFGCFAAYSAQFMAVTSFLPTMLMDHYQVSIPRAAALGALVVAANIVGNLASGWLLRHGWQRHRMLAFAATMMGLCTLVIFNGDLPLALRMTAAATFSAIGGLIPGTLVASAPHYIQRPGQMASMMGFLMQGAGIGQILGPILLTQTVKGFGSWEYAMLCTLAAATLGAGCGMALGRSQPVKTEALRAQRAS